MAQLTRHTVWSAHIQEGVTQREQEYNDTTYQTYCMKCTYTMKGWPRENRNMTQLTRHNVWSTHIQWRGDPKRTGRENTNKKQPQNWPSLGGYQDTPALSSAHYKLLRGCYGLCMYTCQGFIQGGGGKIYGGGGDIPHPPHPQIFTNTVQSTCSYE